MEVDTHKTEQRAFRSGPRAPEPRRVFQPRSLRTTPADNLLTMRLSYWLGL